MGNILRRSTQEVFELDGAEFFDDGALFADALMETLLKFVELAFLFVQVLDEPSSSLLHFVQSAFEPFDNTGHWAVDFSSVLRMPNVVSDEFLDGAFPSLLQQLLVAHHLQLVHESLNILN